MLQPKKTAPLGAVFFSAALLLVGCVHAPWRDPLEQAAATAAQAGFELKKTAAGAFSLTHFLAPGLSGETTLSVYIEGDGAPWTTSTAPPRDPTPTQPMGLFLALREPRRPLLYVARPCQFLGADELKTCHYRHWTSERYAEAAVAAIDALITRSKQVVGARQLRLVGFSGGGVIAALIAARRDDVERLVTVAAPLDTTAWAQLHDLSPLSASLNPADFAAALVGRRQVHLLGEKDSIVPPASVTALRDKLPAAKFVVVEGYDHHCCWQADWPGVLPVEAR